MEGEDVIVCIMLHLPFSILIRGKVACKRWKALIESHYLHKERKGLKCSNEWLIFCPQINGGEGSTDILVVVKTETNKFHEWKTRPL